MSAKKENLNIESSRTTHRGASIVSSLNSNVIKKVFGAVDDGANGGEQEFSSSKSPSFPSKPNFMHPILAVSLNSNLRERVEAINDKRHAEASAKLSSLQLRLADL